ncbi:glutamate-5-semialdehyde dehydrogenase [Clostridium tetani]|uniref:Gamma-glutamyl phosphate reductase n=1 Tax=Clostridium tetani (strain Massachusetts / E88) TaxID=212717 RepID=PROA_CLOTE|nr:glutamate-5-semialdehyde dehydrogenase [Clostridium tetani]Q896G4.1 RecName: Full=Gamma-glutamyl phosphate reductase; Short=GPR; AltName: Full=Glutamate-5-semialdehyde dehydrogenase; AltName: Full=Glutamyl-gamma-semialdehyde dehydrogenase; Short=GSA dehydrogenase [Clostridium tetani E88]AAO35626.1 gamma-glutamyl phosphate reductase [Clostridium tetani E88]KGI36974.1 gamma-glutamyl phosphate reductase [Clostridium tetani]KGI40366.1 gamma-glutamyl phosphate reductase [Clostridium tetani ATCC 9
MDDLNKYLINKGKKAKEASRFLSSVDSNFKNKALHKMGEDLKANMNKIIAANKIDMEKGKEKGLSKSLLDRLLIDEKRVNDMVNGLIEVAELPDPIGEVLNMWKRPNGINIGVKRVPLGVIGIIYEARPNVTVDATALCLKSGNAVILRGGSEAINTNKAIGKILENSAIESGLPEGTIQLIETTDREIVNKMLKLNEYIDVLIPRGGRGLIDNVVKNSTVPVIQTGVGLCHVYVDGSANLKMAQDIIVNAKTQRPGVCNALETLLVHKDVANSFLPEIVSEISKYGVESKLCEKSFEVVKGSIKDAKVLSLISEATEEDWDTEYLDLILSIKIVNSLDEALNHIYDHGTKHSEAIITENYTNSQRFLNEVDAAAVYVNASTRFTDGSQFGFGAEIGISTQKLHARGPMGLTQLTTTKYIIYGNGQIR